MLNKLFFFFISFLFLFTVPNGLIVKAATSNVELIKQNWPFNGVFGRFDQASLQRGFKVYSEVCSACHGLRHISYRDLEGIGYSNDEIKVIAGEYEIYAVLWDEQNTPHRVNGVSIEIDVPEPEEE